MAAHFAYIVSGSLPSGVSGKGKYSLIGCDAVNNWSNISDISSVRGLRMSEIVEWSACRHAGKKMHTEINHNDSKGGLSLGSIFGLGTLNNKVVTPAPSDEAAISAERMLRIRISLCFPKLKFAMWLADLGLLEAAAAYARDARDIVKQCKKNGRICHLLNLL
jgi:hypothetical protein